MEAEIHTCGELAVDAYHPISRADEGVQKHLKPSEKYLYAKGLRVLHEYRPINPKDGFFARCYGNIYTRETAIAFRGTVMHTEPLTADLLLWWGRESGMLKKANDFYSNAWDVMTKRELGTDREGKVLKQYTCNFNPEPALTGHSLGGYLAQYLGVLHHLKTYAFNAPKIGDLHLASGRPYIDPSKDYSHILNIDIDYDEIHTVGTRIGRQHLLHGDVFCSPASYEPYLKHEGFESSQVYMGKIATMVQHRSDCALNEHYMANVMAKMASETERQLEQEGYAVSFTADETLSAQSAS